MAVWISGGGAAAFLYLARHPAGGRVLPRDSHPNDPLATPLPAATNVQA